MVKVRYFNNKEFHESAKSKAFALTNQNGGFFVNGLNSKYGGLHIRVNDKIFKIIEEIRINDKLNYIQNNFYNVKKIGGKFNQIFFFPFKKNSFVYEMGNLEPIDLFLDFKEIDDDRQWGRVYKIYSENEKLIVQFTKKTDSREDNTHNKTEYILYLIIHGLNFKYKILDKWVMKDYDYDKDRGIPPERYVYHSLKLTSPVLVFTISDNKEKAMKESDFIFENLPKLKQKQKRLFYFESKNLGNNKLETAYKCAINSLSSLMVNEGLFAGLPWFYQMWSRDELISLKALIIKKEFKRVKKILIKNIKSITKSGRLPNRVPYSPVQSSDSIGWLYLRFYDFIKSLKKYKLFDKYFTKKEYNQIIKKLERTIELIRKNHLKEGMIYSEEKTTWMDTLDRKGYCLEIQALQLKAYRIMYQLTKKKKYKDYENRLRKEVKNKFWNKSKKFLLDINNDSTIRPNIFIAAYVYYPLLTKKQWSECFSSILPKLWLEWGGLSTIDLNDPKFQGIDTGLNPKAYHGGDSWFWINNLAAFVMFKVDKEKFKFYIDKIINASVDEILFDGFLGAHAEISDALQLKSRGCLTQAWSNALFIELVNKYTVRRRNNKI